MMEIEREGACQLPTHQKRMLTLDSFKPGAAAADGCGRRHGALLVGGRGSHRIGAGAGGKYGAAVAGSARQRTGCKRALALRLHCACTALAFVDLGWAWNSGRWLRARHLAVVRCAQ